MISPSCARLAVGGASDSVPPPPLCAECIYTLHSYIRHRSRQASPSPARVTSRCFTHSIRAECRQRADTGGEEGGRHPANPLVNESERARPPGSVVVGGRRTPLVAAQAAWRDEECRVPIGSLPPRLRRDSSAGVRDLARSLDLHRRLLPFTRPRPCSMDRRSSAQTCGLPKEGL